MKQVENGVSLAFMNIPFCPTCFFHIFNICFTGSSLEIGDSGGGFMVRDESVYYLRGIVSVNKLIRAGKIPTFTDISNYVGWIWEVKREVECRLLNRTNTCP